MNRSHRVRTALVRFWLAVAVVAAIAPPSAARALTSTPARVDGLRMPGVGSSTSQDAPLFLADATLLGVRASLHPLEPTEADIPPRTAPSLHPDSAASNEPPRRATEAVVLPPLLAPAEPPTVALAFAGLAGLLWISRRGHGRRPPPPHAA